MRNGSISALTDEYTPGGATTYRYISMLEEFEDDLHRHIHLENNILFKISGVEEILRCEGDSIHPLSFALF